MGGPAHRSWRRRAEAGSGRRVLVGISELGVIVARHSRRSVSGGTLRPALGPGLIRLVLGGVPLLTTRLLVLDVAPGHDRCLPVGRVAKRWAEPEGNRSDLLMDPPF